MEATAISVWRCNDCDTIHDSEAVESAGPLYECGDCGTTFTRDNSADGMSNRCSDCNKFAGKLTDVSCPEGCESELEELEAFEIEGAIYVPLGAED